MYVEISSGDFPRYSSFCLASSSATLNVLKQFLPVSCLLHTGLCWYVVLIGSPQTLHFKS